MDMSAHNRSSIEEIIYRFIIIGYFFMIRLAIPNTTITIATNFNIVPVDVAKKYSNGNKIK